VSALRVGIQLDEFGRPMRSVLRDEGPGRGRTSAHSATTTPSYRGTLVVGSPGIEERKRESARQLKQDPEGAAA
jgi:hypothetical protein